MLIISYHRVPINTLFISFFPIEFRADMVLFILAFVFFPINDWSLFLIINPIILTSCLLSLSKFQCYVSFSYKDFNFIISMHMQGGRGPLSCKLYCSLTLMLKDIRYFLSNDDWLVKTISVQTFTIIILISREGNFVYHNCLIP